MIWVKNSTFLYMTNPSLLHLSFPGCFPQFGPSGKQCKYCMLKCMINKHTWAICQLWLTLWPFCCLTYYCYRYFCICAAGFVDCGLNPFKNRFLPYCSLAKSHHSIPFETPAYNIKRFAASQSSMHFLLETSVPYSSISCFSYLAAVLPCGSRIKLFWQHWVAGDVIHFCRLRSRVLHKLQLLFPTLVQGQQFHLEKNWCPFALSTVGMQEGRMKQISYIEIARCLFYLKKLCTNSFLASKVSQHLEKPDWPD